MGGTESQGENKKMINHISEEEGLQFLWATIASFNVIYILNLLLLDRTNLLLIDVFHFDDTWESVPVFGLSFGSVVTILSFSFMLALIKKKIGEKWLERIPPLWVDIDMRSELGRTWRRIIFAITLLFPLAAQLYFWLRLYEWQVWENNAQSKLYTLWSYVPPKFFLNWDAYRYGDHSKRFIEEGFGGVSFLPFWQPAIMGCFTAIVLILFGKIILGLRQSVHKKSK
ncbi:MAG: hypothetical protein MI892_11740 [Desulfobacterales bacterium]|nr:hypothetical protein [Desulfobacterales bacterium]